MNSNLLSQHNTVTELFAVSEFILLTGTQVQRGEVYSVPGTWQPSCTSQPRSGSRHGLIFSLLSIQVNPTHAPLWRVTPGSSVHTPYLTASGSLSKYLVTSSIVYSHLRISS